ncbi:MAG TPA: MFS transporter, partial [Ilumatobacteraceae bacterium]|nr:MFS transporter [Ilumatobacteraceae bacterium]
MNRHLPHRAGSRVGDEPTTAPGRFAAFGNRNFRLYFIGQTISSIGSWAQSLAVTWLVLDLTDRSDQLGIALALQFLPMLILGAPAGVLADRLNNRRLLLATSAASGVLALTFGIVVTTGHATIWWIYALTFALGLVLAVERPTMQAILFQLVGRDLLSNAVAANGTINSVSRL